MVKVNTISVIYRFRKQDGRYLSKSLRYFSGLVMSRRWWAGPGLGWASPARPGPANFQRVGRGPARPIKISEDGPRPGPAHQSHFQKITARRGPAHHFFNSLARPGPARHMVARPMRHGLYMDRPENYVGLSVDLTDRPMGWSMCCPVLEGACAYADVIV